MILFLLFLLLFVPNAQAQPATVYYQTAVPSGACTPRDGMRIVISSGATYTCAGGIWAAIGGGGGSIPVGSLYLITSGSCAAGYSEAADLDGLTVIGTIAANLDVGMTGGNDNLTPSGTNSAPTFTGSGDTTSATSAGTPAGTVAAPVFTGSSANTSSDSAGTPAGTNGTGTVTPSGTVAWPAGVPTNASGAFTQGAISWPAGVPTNSAISMSGSTANESAHTHSVTAAGTNNAATFTGTALSSHTHTYTEVPNHVHVQNINTGTTGGSNGYGVDTSTSGSGATAISTANPTGGVATGTTAGPSITLTPAGTNNAATFTGSAVTSAAGSAHLHAIGTIAASTPTISWPAGVPTIAAGSFTQPTISWPVGVPTFSGGLDTTSAQVFTGSALAGHLHTLTATGTNSAPAFTGSALGTHTHTVTATGTVSAPTFTGNAADNRSAFMKVIFCRKL